MSLPIARSILADRAGRGAFNLRPRITLRMSAGNNRCIRVAGLVRARIFEQTLETAETAEITELADRIGLFLRGILCRGGQNTGKKVCQSRVGVTKIKHI